MNQKFKMGDKVKVKDIPLGTKEDDKNIFNCYDKEFIGQTGVITGKGVGNDSFWVEFATARRLFHPNWFELVTDTIKETTVTTFKIGDKVILEKILVGTKENDGNCFNENDGKQIGKIGVITGAGSANISFWVEFDTAARLLHPNWIKLVPESAEVPEILQACPSATKYVTIKNGNGQIFKITSENTFTNGTKSVFFLNDQYLTENDLEKVELEEGQYLQIVEIKKCYMIKSFTESTAQFFHLDGYFPLETLRIIILTEEQKQLKKGDKVEIDYDNTIGVINFIFFNNINQYVDVHITGKTHSIPVHRHSLKKIPSAKKNYLQLSVKLTKE